MAKSKRKQRAQNKISGSSDGTLAKVEPDPFPETAAQLDRSQIHRATLTRSPLLNADFEAVIEIIAIDRVYRAMLQRVAPRLLPGPTHAPPDTA